MKETDLVSEMSRENIRDHWNKMKAKSLRTLRGRPRREIATVLRSSFCAKHLLLLRIRNLEFRNVAMSLEQVTLFGQDEEALWPARVEDLSPSVCEDTPLRQWRFTHIQNDQHT
jgi:hypothetical protein